MSTATVKKNTVKKDTHLLRLLHNGKKTCCWLAKSKKDQEKNGTKQVVIKEAKDPEHNHLVVWEQDIYASLPPHPHIVEFQRGCTDTVTGNHYIVLEYCKNSTLQEMINKRHKLCEEEARYFMKQILCGVQHLHKHDILHRDIKPANIFITRDMCVKLGDFGLSIDLRTINSRTCMAKVGTPNFIAPEVLNDKKYMGYDRKADVWSIGCVFFTMLTGHPPFQGRDAGSTLENVTRNRFTTPLPTLSCVDKDTRDLLLELLNPSPWTRLDCEDALKHPFFHAHVVPDSLPQHTLTFKPVLHKHSNNTKKRNKSKSIWCYLRECIQTALCRHPQEKHVERYTKAEVKQKEDLEALHSYSNTPLPYVLCSTRYDNHGALGYCMSTGTVGVLFKDQTTMLLLHDQETIEYIDNVGTHYFYAKDELDVVVDHSGLQDKGAILLDTFVKMQFKYKQIHSVNKSNNARIYVKHWDCHAGSSNDCSNSNITETEEHLQKAINEDTTWFYLLSNDTVQIGLSVMGCVVGVQHVTFLKDTYRTFQLSRLEHIAPSSHRCLYLVGEFLDLCIKLQE